MTFRQKPRAVAVAVALASLWLTSSRCMAQGRPDNEESLPPIAPRARTYDQHPRFPKVETEPQTRMPASVPKEHLEECSKLMKQISKGDLETAEKACDQVCRTFGNYRWPMDPSDPGSGRYARNALVIVWEDACERLARRYRQKRMDEKAAALEWELVLRGRSWNAPRHTAQRLFKRIELRATVEIPPGPHKPDALIYATVTLENDSDTTVRTELYLETSKGFDKAYRREVGKWNAISHPGNKLCSSPEYEAVIPPRNVWKRRVRVTAHQLEHVGSYELQIRTNWVQCKSNTAVLTYTDKEAAR